MRARAVPLRVRAGRQHRPPPLAKAQDRGFRNRATVQECKPSGAPGCTVERAQPLERGQGPAAGRDQDRQARHPGRGPGRGARGSTAPVAAASCRPTTRAGSRRAGPRREADRGRRVRAPDRAGRGEAGRAGADSDGPHARGAAGHGRTGRRSRALHGDTTDAPRLAPDRSGRLGDAAALAAACPAGDAADGPELRRRGRRAAFDRATGLRRRGGAAVTRDLVRRLEAAEAATARRVRSAAAEARVEAAIRAVPDGVKWRWLSCATVATRRARRPASPPWPRTRNCSRRSSASWPPRKEYSPDAVRSGSRRGLSPERETAPERLPADASSPSSDRSPRPEDQVRWYRPPSVPRPWPS